MVNLANYSYLGQELLDLYETISSSLGFHDSRWHAGALCAFWTPEQAENKKTLSTSLFSQVLCLPKCFWRCYELVGDIRHLLRATQSSGGNFKSSCWFNSNMNIFILTCLSSFTITITCFVLCETIEIVHLLAGITVFGLAWLSRCLRDVSSL